MNVTDDARRHAIIAELVEYFTKADPESGDEITGNDPLEEEPKLYPKPKKNKNGTWKAAGDFDAGGGPVADTGCDDNSQDGSGTDNKKRTKKDVNKTTKQS